MFISDFDATARHDQDGGKGCNLKKLKGFSFNVPEGFIVHSSFYHAIAPKVGALRLDDDEVLVEQCTRLRQEILRVELSADFLDALNVALSTFPEKTRFAVRSSASHEDLAGAAFAGQHDTALNVAAADLPDALRRGFASLWQPHAVRYRARRGISQGDVSMAIVVQRMLDPTAAGVAFSADPVSGVMDVVMIEANYGIGESVVAGEASTDVWRVDTLSGAIVDRVIGEKTTRCVLSDEGVQAREVSDAERAQPCLDDAQIAEVAALTRKIEAAFGCPQDIEWAFAQGRLHVLQARPMTTLPPHFTRDESAERFPDPLTPLTWAYVDETFKASLEHSLALMDISLPTRPWFELENHFVYGNQNAVRTMQMYNPFRFDDEASLLASIDDARERFQWALRLPEAWRRDLDAFLFDLGRLSTVDLDGLETPRGFIDYLMEGFEVGRQYFLPNIAISMTQGLLVKTLFQLALFLTKNPLEARHHLDTILTSATTRTAQINRDMRRLADVARGDEVLLDRLRGDTRAAMNHLEAHPEFNRNFQRFIRDNGHREVTFDYYEPTWAEAPWILLDLIYLYAEQPGDDVKERQREGDAYLACATSTNALLNLASEDLQPFCNELIRLTREYTSLDDLEHFQTTRLNLFSRRVLGVMGRRFVASGTMEDSYDLFFLDRADFEALDSWEMSAALRDQISARKKAYQDAKKSPPPWSLTDDLAPSEDDALDPSCLRGIPGSPGTYQGIVYHVSGPEDFAGLPVGAVLVAKTTNPAWTPLFDRAGALITLSGGPLSHGAITAREVGIPAVMAVREALTQLHNGDAVTVDGVRGIIRC